MNKAPVEELDAIRDRFFAWRFVAVAHARREALARGADPWLAGQAVNNECTTAYTAVQKAVWDRWIDSI